MPVPYFHEDDARPPHRPLGSSRQMLALAGAGLLVLGGAAGGVVVAETRPSVSMAPANPVAIHSLSSSGIVTIRGRVAEMFGNKLILADASGRALVDLGREGDDRQMVSVGEAITVQGRVDHGFVRAAFLIGPDNKVVALGPLDGPLHGPHGRRGPDDGPDGPDNPPPPRPRTDRGLSAPPPAEPAAVTPGAAPAVN